MMVKQQFIKLLASLMMLSLTTPGLTSTCLYSKKMNRVDCNKTDLHKTQESTLEPSFIAYRLAVKGATERKCRLEPTCSKFLIHAIKQHGLSKGVVLGFARSQIKHDDGFGILPTVINKEGMMIILDSVKNWKFFK